MKKTTIIQLILLSLAIIVFGFSYYSYLFNKEENQNLSILFNDIEKNQNDSLKDGAVNYIENLKYNNIDKEGNIFEIFAENTKTYQEEKEFNYMKTVIASISFSNGRVITIHSDEAIYNIYDHNTRFKGNVIIRDEENKIFADNLDLFLDNNLITLYNNVQYNSLGKLLFADKININLLKKETKIYMFDESEKIKINLKN